jgi:hypothetical protein
MADDLIYRKPTRPLRTYTEAEWAKMPPAWRDAYNKLRRQRYLPPRAEPEVDLSPKPYVPPLKPFDSRPPGRGGEVTFSLQELAQAIARDEDRDGALFKALKAATAALPAAHDGDMSALTERLCTRVMTLEERQLAAELLNPTKRRAAHRPKPLTRELAEHEAARILDIWDRSAPQERKDQKTVLREIKNAYGISRSQALKILKTVRETRKALACNP